TRHAPSLHGSPGVPLQRDGARAPDPPAAPRREMEEAQPPPSPAASAAPAMFRRAPWIAAAAAMLVVGALIGAWFTSNLRPPQVDTRVLRLQIEPPPGGEFVLGGNGPMVGTIALSPS